MMRILSLAAITLLFAVNAIALDGVTQDKPGEQVMATIDSVREEVSLDKGKLSTEMLDKKLIEVIAPRFDFREMSQRSLGPAWNKANAAEQTEFVDLFSELLARTYVHKIRNNIETTKITLADQKIQGTKAIVRTSVDDGKDQYSIDYRLLLRDAEWQIYDVIVENVGLVTNYRNEFAGILQKEKFAGLLTRLREKKIKEKPIAKQ